MLQMILKCPNLLSGPVLSIKRAVRARNLHQDVVALTQVAFGETNANRELDTSIGLDTVPLGPAGRAAAFLMKHMVRRCR